MNSEKLQKVTKKTHKLQSDPEYNFQLLGISSHENDYRLSWSLNEALSFKLVKTNNLEILNRKFSEKQEFSLYTFEDEETLVKYNLLSNRCDNGFLLEEMKNIDFLLQIFGEISKEELQRLISDLNDIDIITMCFGIDISTLKSKDKLVY